VINQPTRLENWLACGNCNRVNGATDRATGGWRLMKRDMILDKERIATEFGPELPIIDRKFDAWSVGKWFTADLLNSIENDGVRRFLVSPTGPNADTQDAMLVRHLSLHSVV
jgi:hypothetical protein